MEQKRHGSVRCAVTTHLAIIMESGPVRAAKLFSREAFKVTMTMSVQRPTSALLTEIAGRAAKHADYASAMK